MSYKNFLKLSEPDRQRFHESLFYLKMEELRDICKRLLLPSSGKKIDLIERIWHFLTTGEVIKQAIIPEISRAQKGKAYPLKPDTLILFGSYKNDLKTRLFMKKLVGDHFHFTAFGVDWTMERWLAENPPTYQEFADFWQREYMRRKQLAASPKQEWAYLSFVQRFLQLKPKASRSEIVAAWEELREKRVAFVLSCLIEEIGN